MKHERFMIILYGIITLLNGICGILYTYQGRWIIGAIWIVAAIFWGMNLNNAINKYIDLKDSFFK